MQVTALFIYPIKATTAISLEQAEVRPRGLAGDRRWVVVDDNGHFLQQRTHTKMALVKTTSQRNGGLLISATDMEPLTVSPPIGKERGQVTVWSDTVDAANAGPDAAAWFSRFLGLPCRLMFMDDAALRPVAPEYGQDGDVVSFADALPLLLATAASLADLNQRIGSKKQLPMSRFRPNLVVDGDAPWAEDQWKRVRVGQIEFEVTHPCARCVVTTTDQQTGEKSPDGEPLKTLATFRRGEKGVLFGMNLVPRNHGTIRVGDHVAIIDRS
jgi:MOSC domain-containing protein